MTDAISSILSQIRAHEMRTRGATGDAPASNAIGTLGSGATGGVNGATAPGFQQTLANAVEQVNQTQANASSLQQAFEMGDPRADLARVMVAMQQSQVAFRATVEVRNRLVQAYQDVMNMPI
ncbi:flagellar hook-basal body complex protein FliE [Lysobacter sp. Root494]|uniref:flagellar hook-basal body complex protein FliE n=1 Tax=Lysobacter sp. Root494 TaxID=1736549 RepID=UPI0006FB474C|nr:flagellar hook-basal body complex protein FliE [Lysobacter sp. Root494]KQY52708.1 flagellar hook-basal body protein [Lysobacter sp. Root494]